jgi:hypothetical protein
VLQAYAERFGKARWGDKRPGYYQDVRVLLRLFPDAQFVHVVRDGRDCVASLKRMPWWRAGSTHAFATWVEALEQGRHWSGELGPARWHTVQYEHLLAEPEAELRRLCGFLGETYHPAMLRTGEVAEVAVPQRKTWHARTAQPMDSTRIAAYRSGLDHDELALIEWVAGPWLERYGYPLSGAGRPSRLLLQDYRLTSIKRRAARRKRALEDVVRDARSRAPVAAMPHSIQLPNRDHADRRSG